jgi:hypothetical protein
MLGGNVNFVTGLTGEADPEQPRPNPGDDCLAHAHMRHAIPDKINTGDNRRHHLPRARPLHRDDSPLLGDRGQPDTQLRELGLQIVLHMVQHRGRTARGGGDMEPIRRQPCHHAVIQHEPGFVQ